jgi:hypothetical protein
VFRVPEPQTSDFKPQTKLVSGFLMLTNTASIPNFIGMKCTAFLLAMAACLLLLSASTNAQLPNTDIFLLDISGTGDSMQFSNPRNITNREGYDNQPWFINDSALLFVAAHSNQTDVYRYEVVSSLTTQITKTPESEYSPQFTPDGFYLSVVRVEENGAQLLSGYSLSGKPELNYWPANTRLGYYCWLDEKRVAAFVLPDTAAGDTSTHLELYNIFTKQTTEIKGNIGRTLALRPDTAALTFVNKFGALWWIECLYWNQQRMQMDELVFAKDKNEDFCWTPDGKLLMGSKGKLYYFDPRAGHYDWTLIADFTNTAYGNFSRLAVSPGGKLLALVVTQPAR